MPVLEHERVLDRRVVGGGADRLYAGSWSNRWQRPDPAPYDDPDLAIIMLVDRNTSLVKPPHVPRDWQEHHQGHDYGLVLGGILGFVILGLVGGYAFVRWHRARNRKPSNTSHIELENTPIKGSPSVDSAPLLIITENWTPRLNRISEQTEETSALSTSRKETTFRSPLLKQEPEDTEEELELDLHPVQEGTPTRDPSLPEPSLQKETIADDGDEYEQEDRLYPEEAPFPLYQLQVSSVDDLETTNISASDSDSMQVNIPWRNSARFTTLRTQSLPLEPDTPPSPITPSPRTHKNMRHSYALPLPSSPLHLRAVAEEEREQSQASHSTPPTALSGKALSGVDDNASMNESEGSETASTLSSLAKLKLRLTGSAPFLPLIQESSPLDTDNLWGRVQGRPSPSSTKSPSLISGKRLSSKLPQSSSAHCLPSSRPHSQSHSASSKSSHIFIMSRPRSVSPQPTSPKSASSTSSSPKPPSPKPSPPLASPPLPLTSRDRSVSSSSPPVASPDPTLDVPPVIKLTPDLPPIPSPISHLSPWQTHSSPLTLYGTVDSHTSASSLVLRDLLDFPEPPNFRPHPRPLPKRPLPHIPPPPSYLPPMPPVRILGQRDAESNMPAASSRSPLNERDVQSNMPIAFPSQSSSMNDSNSGVRLLPAPGPSKLSLVIQ